MPTLHNWNNQITFGVPEKNFKKPSNIQEVQAIIKDASAANAKVKVVGGMHSVTPCFVGSDIIMSNENMAEILSLDKENMTVTVQAGVTIHQLCGYLKPLGYQSPVILEYGNFVSLEDRSLTLFETSADLHPSPFAALRRGQRYHGK